LNVDLSIDKIKRYKKKIDLTFHNHIYEKKKNYLGLVDINEKEANGLLLKRLRYLTSNVRLL
jgi:hypothetical protein